ncbi:MAG: type II toxin-antitoxin system RelE/ParE family toxin [Candidatus Diapherotrites archaeon]|nr:type II toxin-antitoxin system RelE/ParE family toxin [Candidatus Diapherotrites archaeon]
MHEIRYSEEFNKDYVKLREKADKGNGEAKYLLELISKATAKLALNREAGKKIPHKQWPREYIDKHDVTNLWKLNLDSYWRLVYTITGTEVSMFLIYLEYLNHKEYDRKFKYKTS